MSPEQARLRRRRPYARTVFARAVEPEDVLHPAGNALRVLAGPVPVQTRHGGRVQVRVRDEYPNGEPHERTLLWEPMRPILVSRAKKPARIG